MKRKYFFVILFLIFDIRYTQGDTYEEVLENIKDAIRLHVNDRLDSGEEVPQSQSVSLTSLEVAV